MITISTDPALLDTAFIHGFLAETYWAKGRTLPEVEKAIATC